jgi:transcriptional regulator GlxA family with amidase domain
LQEQAFPYGFARRKELGFELLRILCEIAPARADSLDFLHHSERLVPVFTFVDEHMDEPITVSDLADLANLSLSRFHVFFKEHMGESPMGYIKRVRLERSRQVLATTDVPIYAVAESVGFVNPFHFSRAFKEEVGMSPSHYRKQLHEVQPIESV